MGLLDGRRALIFGVANDHSIAWGIARALHAEGAEVGFSSIESLIEKRVRPLAQSIGSTFVEPCDVQSDEQIRAVFQRWQAVHGEDVGLDILVHALAFARLSCQCDRRVLKDLFAVLVVGAADHCVWVVLEYLDC